VLKRHGGFLNKISGDSLMFHIGGNIDPATKGKTKEEAEEYIARTLLYTCIDIQKICRLFNEADKEFLARYENENTRQALQKAFTIISVLRENLAMVSGINAMFQVKVRIGACLGEVCIGNFGPQGATQWDVIGEPVIEARRMESTAPIDGLRISNSLYETLDKTGIIDLYLEEFRKEAEERNGYFSRIGREELFAPKSVTLFDKKNKKFDSFAVQTNPMMPEDIRYQMESYLEKDEDGAQRIIELLKYHRGNRLVIKAAEEMFVKKGVQIRKDELYKKLHPRRYHQIFESVNGKEKVLSHVINRKVPLFLLFKILGHYQDSMNSRNIKEVESINFSDFSHYISAVENNLQNLYSRHKKARERYLYFNDVLFPFVFGHLKASILEYQARQKLKDVQMAS
jgi:class 3 adenylate cyclase